MREGVNQTTRRKQLQWLCCAAVCKGCLRENRSRIETAIGQSGLQTSTNRFSSLFPGPKELDNSDRQKSGIVYKQKGH